MIAARPLVDDVPGNIGLLVDANEVVRLHFNEIDGIMPSDAAGGLLDLQPPAAHVAPPSVPSWSGLGRSFTPATLHALVAADDPGADTLLTRDVTVRAILSLNLAAAAGVMTLVSRGIGGSAAEYYALGLELQNQGGGNHGTIDVRWFWATTAGVLKTQTAGTFTWPGDGVTFVLTATRRWVSTTSVVIRYYVDDQLISEVTSSDGDIGGGTTGTTSIGARRTAGTWGRYFAGVVDELQIIEGEQSREEIEATWLRLSKHQPDGVARFVALAPPGAPWADDRGNRIGRLVKGIGQGLGLAAARTDELSANWLPDRAYADWLPRWEAMLGIAPRPSDSLDTRRARCVAMLQRDNGYSVPKLQATLTDLLDQSAVLVDVREFSPTWEDDFKTLETERWDCQPAARWSINSADRLRLAALAGDDLRWDATTMSACRARAALYTVSGGNPAKQAKARLGVVAQVLIRGVGGTTPNDVLYGLQLYSFATNESLWFGMRRHAGDYDLGYQTYVGGVASGFQLLASAVGNLSPRLRIRASATVAGDYTLEYSVDEADFVAMTPATSISLGATFTPDYVCLGAVQDAGTLAANLTVDFDDFLLRTPFGERAFHWFAYRDLGLGGSPDMIGANQVLRKLRPAHTHAYAITSLSLKCDDPASVCDGGPAGAL